MTTKQQPQAAPTAHDRRAAALRANLLKRKQQAEMRKIRAVESKEEVHE